MGKKVSRKVNSYKKERIIEIVRKVCDNYKTGEYTLESCCANAGVPYRTYKDWWSRYEAEPDSINSKWHFLAGLAGLWGEAKKEHRRINEEALIHKAESLLLKAVSGYEYEETIVVYKRSVDMDGNEVLVQSGFRKHKKYRPPSDRAIQFVLTKLKPEVYGNTEVTTSLQLYTNFGQLTLEEIEFEIKKLEAILSLE